MQAKSSLVRTVQQLCSHRGLVLEFYWVEVWPAKRHIDRKTGNDCDHSAGTCTRALHLNTFYGRNPSAPIYYLYIYVASQQLSGQER